MKKSINKISYLLIAAVMVLIAASLMAGEPAYASSATWPSFRGNEYNNGLVSFSTPIDQKTTEPAWCRQFSDPASGMSGWAYAPCTPIIVEGDLITTSAKQILRLDPESGGTIDSGTMSASVNWGNTPPTYAEMEDRTGVIFCPLSGGIIEAFDADDLKRGPLWTFRAAEKDESGQSIWGLTPENAEGQEVASAVHQSISPIVYSDGIVYTGFYGGAYDFYDYYVAIAAVEQTLPDPETGIEKVYKPGELIWKYKSKGGFYWNGGVAVGDAIIVGTQDGMNNNDVTGSSGKSAEDSRIIALDKKTGRVISEVVLPEAGDICSSIVYDKTDTGRLYWSACGGYLFSAYVDPATGEIPEIDPYTEKENIQYTLLARKTRSPLTVCTPVVYKGRVYLCFKTNDRKAPNCFAAYDAETLAPQFEKALDHYTKSSPLITNAYEKSTEYIYAYVADYEEPGGVTVIKFRSNAIDDGDVTASTLFAANGYEQYGAASLISDNMGQLYYRNDSNTIFAIRKCAELKLGAVTGFKITPAKGKYTIKYKKTKNATKYRILYRVNEKGSFKRVDTKKLKYVVKVKSPSVITVKVRPEHIDAAKKVYGSYNTPVTVLYSTSSIKKLTAGTNSFTVQFNKVKISDGYQIQYSTVKSMKYAPSVTRKGYSKTKQTVTGLVGGRTYYVRVRAYKVVNQTKVNGKWTGGTTLYGKWSSKKKVKVKSSSIYTGQSSYQQGGLR